MKSIASPQQTKDASVKIAVIADAHVGGDGTEFERAIELCNGLVVDFVALLGDFVEPATAGTLDAFVRALRSLQKPFYLVAGNVETCPEARAGGINVGRELQRTFPGPWEQSFTYAFERSGRQFIVVGGIRHVPVDVGSGYPRGRQGLHVAGLPRTSV